MSDDETCPKPALEEACKKHCVKYLVAYEVRERRGRVWAGGAGAVRRAADSARRGAARRAKQNASVQGPRTRRRFHFSATTRSQQRWPHGSAGRLRSHGPLRERSSFRAQRRAAARLRLLFLHSGRLVAPSHGQAGPVRGEPSVWAVCASWKNAKRGRAVPAVRPLTLQTTRPALLTHTLSLQPTTAHQACAKRIEGKADAHCTGQYFDLWHCIDKCVAPKLFPLLK